MNCLITVTADNQGFPPPCGHYLDPSRFFPSSLLLQVGEFANVMDKRDALWYRIAPLDMTPGEFRKAGHELIERIAEFLCTLPKRPVAPKETLRKSQSNVSY